MRTSKRDLSLKLYHAIRRVVVLVARPKSVLIGLSDGGAANCDGPREIEHAHANWKRARSPILELAPGVAVPPGSCPRQMDQLCRRRPQTPGSLVGITALIRFYAVELF